MLKVLNENYAMMTNLCFTVSERGVYALLLEAQSGRKVPLTTRRDVTCCELADVLFSNVRLLSSYSSMYTKQVLTTHGLYKSKCLTEMEAGHCVILYVIML